MIMLQTDNYETGHRLIYSHINKQIDKHDSWYPTAGRVVVETLSLI